MSRGELTYDYLVELIGREAAERLSEVRGGRRMYLPPPHRLGPNCPLVRAVGAAAARVLVKSLQPGEMISVPIGPGKRSRIRALRTEGRSIDEIAADLRCTRRHVFYVLAEEPPPATEPPPLLALMGAVR